MDDEKKRPSKIRKHKWTLIFTACLTAFTVFISLDTFVLSSTYQADATQMNLAMIQEHKKAQENSQTQSGSDTQSGTPESEQTEEKDTGNAQTQSESDAQSGTPESEQTEEKNTGNSQAQSGSDTRSDAQGAEGAEEKETFPGREDGSSQDSSSSSGRKKHRKPFGSGGNHFPGSDGAGSSNGKGSRTFNEEEAAQSAAEVTTENADSESTQTYQDDNILITYKEYTTNGTTVHVADVQISSVEYLKTAFAYDTYGKNVTQSTSDIAASHKAILAVNGDYYGVQEKGYVIRNGIVYRDKADTDDVLCIYADGSMKVVDPSTVTAQELVEQGVWQAFSFGPGLIEDGSISVSLDTEVGRAKASNPRTAVGILDDLHYVFVVSDGRTGDSEGLSLYELASFMQQLGAKTAYNLDGGGSSTMVFQGTIMNNPTGGFGEGEREVSDIVYIG